MEKVAKFSKVSFKQFKKDWFDTFGVKVGEDDDYVREIYDNIKLPTRATTGSAGYDFHAPTSFNMPKDHVLKIPTGIRCEMFDGWVLMLYPRSGHGFKYGVKMANTTGVVDSDYFFSDNEGHIFVKLVNNDVNLCKEYSINAGDGFCQGVFLPFGITVDDECDGIRNGGFGSTDTPRGLRANSMIADEAAFAGKEKSKDNFGLEEIFQKSYEYVSKKFADESSKCR